MAAAALGAVMAAIFLPARAAATVDGPARPAAVSPVPAAPAALVAAEPAVLTAAGADHSR